jgi:HSP20 family protein
MKPIMIHHRQPTYGDALARRVFSPAFRFPVLDDLVERFFENSWASPSFHGDLYADDEAYHLRVDLPGLPKEAIKLSVERGQLTISADHAGEHESRTTVRQTISLPEDVDADAISARSENGVLTVRLPKQEAHRPRSIAVE